jgi:disulfide bond formation protein DsbB
MVDTVVNLLATLTLVGDVIIIVVLLLLAAQLLFKANYLLQLKKLISPHAYLGTFIVSLVATLGSLFFSEVAKWEPCVLCWYQRVLMYPQTLLLYTGIMRNERVLKPYLLILNSVGAMIATYHYMIQRDPSLSLLPCTASGPSCTFVPNFYYGYISIPFMALTAFVLIILLMTMFHPSKHATVKHSRRS